MLFFLLHCIVLQEVSGHEVRTPSLLPPSPIYPTVQDPSDNKASQAQMETHMLVVLPWLLVVACLVVLLVVFPNISKYCRVQHEDPEHLRSLASQCDRAHVLTRTDKSIFRKVVIL